MQQSAVVLPFVRVADLPIARQFPLRFKRDNTLCVAYFTTDDARMERAASLVHAGVGCALLPRVAAQA